MQGGRRTVGQFLKVCTSIAGIMKVDFGGGERTCLILVVVNINKKERKERTGFGNASGWEVMSLEPPGNLRMEAKEARRS